MNLIEEYNRLKYHIAIELDNLKNDYYDLVVDDDYPWEYCDYETGEPEWFAVTALKKREIWMIEYDGEFEVSFHKIPMKMQCEIIEHVKSREI